jgi:hypothetical protein
MAGDYFVPCNRWIVGMQANCLEQSLRPPWMVEMQIDCLEQSLRPPWMVEMQIDCLEQSLPLPVGIKKAPCGAFFVNRIAALSNLIRSSFACFYYTNCFSVKRATGFENHVAVCFSKQCVVATHAYVSACVEFSATLANQNVAGDNYLSTEFLNAESF